MVRGIPTKYIIGITLQRFEGVEDKILRFIKFRMIQDHIQDMIRQLQPHIATHEDSIRSSKEDANDEPNKRLKL